MRGAKIDYGFLNPRRGQALPRIRDMSIVGAINFAISIGLYFTFGETAFLIGIGTTVLFIILYFRPMLWIHSFCPAGQMPISIEGDDIMRKEDGTVKVVTSRAITLVGDTSACRLGEFDMRRHVKQLVKIGDLAEKSIKDEQKVKRGAKGGMGKQPTLEQQANQMQNQLVDAIKKQRSLVELLEKYTPKTLRRSRAKHIGRGKQEKKSEDDGELDLRKFQMFLDVVQVRWYCHAHGKHIMVTIGPDFRLKGGVPGVDKPGKRHLLHGPIIEFWGKQWEWQVMGCKFKPPLLVHIPTPHEWGTETSSLGVIDHIANVLQNIGALGQNTTSLVEILLIKLQGLNVDKTTLQLELKKARIGSLEGFLATGKTRDEAETALKARMAEQNKPVPKHTDLTKVKNFLKQPKVIVGIILLAALGVFGHSYMHWF